MLVKTLRERPVILTLHSGSCLILFPRTQPLLKEPNATTSCRFGTDQSFCMLFSSFFKFSFSSSFFLLPFCLQSRSGQRPVCSEAGRNLCAQHVVWHSVLPKVGSGLAARHGCSATLRNTIFRKPKHCCLAGFKSDDAFPLFFFVLLLVCASLFHIFF